MLQKDKPRGGDSEVANPAGGPHGAPGGGGARPLQEGARPPAPAPEGLTP